VALSPEILAAVQRWGPSVDSVAKQHGISGAALLAKLIQGESGGISNRTSTAGAKGLTQFMPGSRQISIQKYGVDPWADVDQAVHAASLHLRGKINGSTGLQGYNPGMPTYTSYILGQKVGNVAGGARPSPVRNTGPAATPTGSAPAAATPGLPQITGGGQAGDFTSLLSSLLTRPEQQQAAPMPIAPPSFAATPALPKGFTPATSIAPVQAPQQDRVSRALSLVEALGATGPTVGSPGAPEGAEGATAAPVVETVQQDRSNKTAGAGNALAWAESKIGFKETGTNSGGLASYANERFGMSGQPWCAMFTSLAVTKGGAPKSARTASVAEVRRQATEGGGGYQRGFVNPGSAKAGDLILFGNDHIGMVQRVEGGKVFYVGGNQSNGVTEARVAVGGGDIVRPKYGARKR